MKRYLQKFINWIIHFLSGIFNLALPGCRWRSFLLSSIHSIWMIAFSLLWLTHIYLFDNFDFMNDIMDYRGLISQNVMKSEADKSLTDNFLLLNSTRNNQIVPLDNDNKTNTVITDRKELTRVLNILDKNSWKINYIICDIVFEDSDPLNDSSLQAVFNRLNTKKKIIIPYYAINIDERDFFSPIIQSKKGLSQYQSSLMNNQFLKFSYISYDSMKQIPLLVYEDVTGHTMRRHTFIGVEYFTMNGQWCLNTVIPAFRYTSDNLISDETYYDLGIFIPELIGNKQIVIIGDFEGISDTHHSIVDKVTGSLILLNTLEALIMEDNILHLRYLIILFIFFLIISYHTFYKVRINDYLSTRNESNMVLRFIRSKINYLSILIITLISILFFQFYFDLFILLGYFAFIEFSIWLLQFRNIKHKLKK